MGVAAFHSRVMRVFLSIKYHSDHANCSRIEAILAALEQRGAQSVCIARDVERWGKYEFDPAELMRRTFIEIDASDLVVVDLTEKGVGVGIEAGYAHAKQIPFVTIAQRGADISETLQGISRAVWFYDGLADFPRVISQIELQGTL
jgi:nucleoside 2-deoxyribosyltransferase